MSAPSPELTDEENVRLMGTHGIKISLSTLKRWRKENNITKYYKSVIPTTYENGLNQVLMHPLL